MVIVALRSYFLTDSSELVLSSPDAVQEAIRSLKVGKIQDRKGIPKRAMK